MVRYQLNDKGISELKGFIYEHGLDDMVEAYLSEAESIASHAYYANMPALLTVDTRSDEGEFCLPLEREWFKVAA